jgi:hypothetical protein
MLSLLLLLSLLSASLSFSPHLRTPAPLSFSSSPPSSSSLFASDTKFGRGGGLTGVQVDRFGNNIVIKDALTKASESGLLTKVYQSGLLSKADAAGVSLSSLEPLLKLTEKNPDLLLIVEAAGPDFLKLLPTIVDTTPALLPLLSLAISIPPPLIAAGAPAGLAGAFLLLQDGLGDTVPEVAAHTLGGIVLGGILPAVSLGGAFVLSKLTCGT